jgi:hypothetical protein
MEAIKYIKHERVKEDGTFEDKSGAIHTTAGIKRGGACPCGCTGQHWLTVSRGRNSKGEVEIISYRGTKEEIDRIYPEVKRIYDFLIGT